MKIVAVGGRIKSAAVGLDIFKSNGDNFQEDMRQLRKKPPRELLEAFFPSDNARLKQMMNGVGFYRPTMKTDQGMGGNFLPFYINSDLEKTDFSVRNVANEEGLLIPELYLQHDGMVVQELQEAFRKMDFRRTYQILEPILTAESREADKGRTPFFFIRPAVLSSPIVFGRDVIEKVFQEATLLLEEAKNRAAVMAGSGLPQDLLYFLADAYITASGEVTIEKLHFPDVGFFITELSLNNSIAKEAQTVVHKIREEVFGYLADYLPKTVYLVTRDEVLDRKEDVLEIFEIQSISRRLSEIGVNVEVKGVDHVGEIPTHATCLLLNINKHSPALLERYGRGELVCCPSPYLQIVSRELTGLRESTVPAKFMDKFLGLIGCDPKNDQSADGILSQIDNLLTRDGITGDFLHVEINKQEIVPVHRRIHHSWKRVSNRITGQSKGILKIREIPLSTRNSLITSSTGPRAHVFRFTFLAR